MSAKLYHVDRGPALEQLLANHNDWARITGGPGWEIVKTSDPELGKALQAIGAEKFPNLNCSIAKLKTKQAAQLKPQAQKLIGAGSADPVTVADLLDDLLTGIEMDHLEGVQ